MNRRSFVGVTISSIVGCALPQRPHAVTLARPRPSPSQLAWQRDELALFLHFGVNTFTDREWGDGREDPAIFAPSNLDARQWTRAAKAAGAKALILTAKHHDGFCLWPTRTTQHSVAKSPWRSGQGDVVREFVDACKAEGLKAGLYLSPWDRNSPVYGDSPRYNDFYCDQLTELLTRYGAISEVWFDGANGEGPNGRRQVYDWPRIFGLVRRLQPRAVMFSDAGPDVRWCGNEAGVAGDPNWSSVDPAAVPYPGASGGAVIAALQHGDPHGAVWRPAEDFAAGRPVDWRVTGRRTAVAHVDLGKAVTIGLARLEEDIARGQCVARYAIQGTADGRDWRELARGTTVGYRKVDRFEPTAARNVRVVVEDAVATPRPLRFGLYRGA